MTAFLIGVAFGALPTALWACHLYFAGRDRAYDEINAVVDKWAEQINERETDA